MTKRIWAVGASVRALAQSLAAAGCEVLAADLFADHDLQQIAQARQIGDYPRDLLALADEIDADGWIYAGGLENFAALVDQLAAKVPLLGNAGDVLRRVRHVPTLQGVLPRAGFRMPEMANELPDGERGRWLRKLPHSSGGLRVDWAGRGGASGDDVYYQRYIEGTVCGAVYVAGRSQTRLLGVTRQLVGVRWTGAPGFHYAGSVGPRVLPDELREGIVRLGELLASEFDLRGWFGVDFILDEHSQMWILEVNPRYTASIEVLEAAAGRTSAPLHLQACTDEPHDAWPAAELGRFCGKAVLYATERLLVTPNVQAKLLEEPGLADIPTVDAIVPRGSPLITLLARGESESAVLDRLQIKAKRLRRLFDTR